jgi:hypothetical protein
MGESSFNPSYAIAYTIKFEILKVEMFTLNFLTTRLTACG